MQKTGGMKSNSILYACDNYLRGGVKVKKRPARHYTFFELHSSTVR